MEHIRQVKIEQVRKRACPALLVLFLHFNQMEHIRQVKIEQVRKGLAPLYLFFSYTSTRWNTSGKLK
jgi:hypothetical protein